MAVDLAQPYEVAEGDVVVRYKEAVVEEVEDSQGNAEAASGHSLALVDSAEDIQDN